MPAACVRTLPCAKTRFTYRGDARGRRANALRPDSRTAAGSAGRNPGAGAGCYVAVSHAESSAWGGGIEKLAN
jgi:hypothetical protein